MTTLDELARAGIEAINEQRYDDALERFRAALELDPDRADLNNALGMTHLHRGEVGLAVPHLEKAVALAEPFAGDEHQDMKCHFHLALASAYQLHDRVAEARRILEVAVERWPGAEEPRLQLGQLLIGSCALDDGLRVYRDALEVLSDERRPAGEALVGAIGAFLEADHPPSVFLEAHRESYVSYFDEVAAQQESNGWYAEAARMGRGPNGDPVPLVADGARSWALTRVDLVNPADGTLAGVYSDTDPMVVAVEGLEPLAQIPVVFRWDDFPFEVWVGTRCPWHWLGFTVQFQVPSEPEQLIERIDELFGAWYLSGYNGEFGDRERGRFHYATDPEVLGDRAVSYIVDLGRARYEAVPALLRRLVVLHDTHRIHRVLIGEARLPPQS